MKVIQSVIEQHAEEAAFLWLLRDAAVRAPHYNLKDLAKLDDRIEAHIDGLRIAGDAGWQLCQQALSQEAPGEVFAASVLAFESGDKGRTHTAVTAGCQSPETFRGLISALGWLPFSLIELWVQRLLNAKLPIYRRIAIAACAIHRQNPGAALEAAVDDPDLSLQARALRAVGELQRRNLLPALRQRLKSEDDRCRFWAAWSAGLLHDARGISHLQHFVENGSLFQERALPLVLRAMNPSEAGDWLRNLMQNPKLARVVVVSGGIIGNPASIPWLIKQIKNPELARVAGEAFTLITGVDLAYEDLEGEQPENFEAGPTENPEDEEVAMDPDEDLPWPDPKRIQTWWSTNKDRFQAGFRYLVGQPITPAHCQRVLVTGRQRQRTAAALELALLLPDTPLFETRAPGFRQQQALTKQPG
jgi:uncharacterized protein (TIGR02270 family)